MSIGCAPAVFAGRDALGSARSALPTLRTEVTAAAAKPPRKTVRRETPSGQAPGILGFIIVLLGMNSFPRIVRLSAEPHNEWLGLRQSRLPCASRRNHHLGYLSAWYLERRVANDRAPPRLASGDRRGRKRMISELRKRFLILFLAIATAVVSAGSQEAPKKPAAPPTAPSTQITTKPASTALPTIKYEKYTLSNGLEVILSEDHRLPLVAVDLWYHVGPANELQGRTGFAHLFEHMMFEGSRHVPGNTHFHLLE